MQPYSPSVSSPDGGHDEVLCAPLVDGASAPSRRRVRSLSVLGVVIALTATAGCGLRIGDGTSLELPTPSAAQAQREGLARQGVLIASTAQQAALSPDSATASVAEPLAQVAQEQVTALGGTWDPWATTAPTDYPTVTPVATAAPGAGRDALVTALADGVTATREAATQSTVEQEVSLYGALMVSWSAALASLDPANTALSAAPRSVETLTEPLDGQLLLAYDAARYAMEEVASRAGDDVRPHAIQDADLAKAVVSACVALGGQDTRLPAYQPPTGEGSTDPLWAQEAWSEVSDAEVANLSAVSGEARSLALAAAVDARARAVAWGATVPALPGYKVGDTAASSTTQIPATSSAAPSAAPTR